MSYGFSADLQTAVYQHLVSDETLRSLVGEAVFDAPPEDTSVTPADYLTLGEETVRSNDTKTSRGAIHDFSVTVESRQDGFDGAKRIAGAVCDRLVDADLHLDSGVLVGIRLLRARARRSPAPVKRQIALRFRAVVDEI